MAQTSDAYELARMIDQQEGDDDDDETQDAAAGVSCRSRTSEIMWLSQVETHLEARPTCTYSGAARGRRET